MLKCGSIPVISTKRCSFPKLLTLEAQLGKLIQDFSVEIFLQKPCNFPKCGEDPPNFLNFSCPCDCECGNNKPLCGDFLKLYHIYDEGWDGQILAQN